MKNNLLLAMGLLGIMFVQSQNITLSIENAQITNDGSDDYYEADIMIAADTDYVQGSGQFFLDYNTAAFGTSIQGSGAITFERPLTAILGTQTFAVDNYNSFVVNDNTTSKVSFLWQQFWSEGTIGGANVTATPTVLVHLKIRYIDSNEATNLCFDTTSNPAFDDQFFTACGPVTGPAGADCGGEPGIQIMNFTPDCTNAEPTPLSVEEEQLEYLLVYPNPTSASFFIKGLQQKVGLEIYDVNGKLIIKREQYQGEEIITRHLASGMYLIKISISNAIQVKRLIIE